MGANSSCDAIEKAGARAHGALLRCLVSCHGFAPCPGVNGPMSAIARLPPNHRPHRNQGTQKRIDTGWSAAACRRARRASGCGNRSCSPSPKKRTPADPRARRRAAPAGCIGKARVIDPVSGGPVIRHAHHKGHSMHCVRFTELSRASCRATQPHGREPASYNCPSQRAHSSMVRAEDS